MKRENNREIALAKLIYGKIKERHVCTLKCNEDSLISFESFFCKIQKPCVYCGQEKSSYVVDRAKGSFIFYYNGLDRINSDLGYTDENTVPACYSCNVAKGEMSTESFKKHIIRIHEYQLKEKSK